MILKSKVQIESFCTLLNKYRTFFGDFEINKKNCAHFLKINHTMVVSLLKIFKAVKGVIEFDKRKVGESIDGYKILSTISIRLISISQDSSLKDYKDDLMEESFFILNSLHSASGRTGLLTEKMDFLCGVCFENIDFSTSMLQRFKFVDNYLECKKKITIPIDFVHFSHLIAEKLVNMLDYACNFGGYNVGKDKGCIYYYFFYFSFFLTIFSFVYNLYVIFYCFYTIFSF